MFLELLAELTLRRVVDRAVHHTGGSFARRRGLTWRCPSCGGIRLRRRRHYADQFAVLLVFIVLLTIAILLAGASAFILGWAILAALHLANWYVEAPIWVCLVLGPAGLAVSYLLIGRAPRGTQPASILRGLQVRVRADRAGAGPVTRTGPSA